METLQLPSTIRDVIKARVDRLSPSARTVANLAAVIGTRAGHDTLTAGAAAEALHAGTAARHLS